MFEFADMHPVVFKVFKIVEDEFYGNFIGAFNADVVHKY